MQQPDQESGKRPFKVFKSSAGSGKTFTLVKEYLKIVLLNPSSYQHILAITFTNKAANEMKDRILSNLTALSSPNQNPDTGAIKHLLPQLIKETGLTEEMVQNRSSKVLKLILHNYSNFSIGTIDSFIHRVVRTFAHDLDLPLNFNVELDDDWLISQAVDLLISKAGVDQKLTKTLLNFVEYRLDDARSWDIDLELKNFAKSLLNEEGQFYLEKIKDLTLDDFTSINHAIRKYISEFKATVSQVATEAVNHIQHHGLKTEDFFGGSRGIGKYFEKLSMGRLNNIQPKSSVIKTIEENKWYTQKTSDQNKDIIDSIRDDLTRYFVSIQDLAEKHLKRYTFLSLVYRNLYSLAVLNEIGRILEDIKAEKNMVHISEFNKRIAEIVLNEPVPFIYERLGEKYKHFLIDEFQDTSVLQWQNLLPLVENALAVQNLNLLVGDGKQAIYRWRNGDVEQFMQLPYLKNKEESNLIYDREQALIRNFEDKSLDNNYRSKKTIIEFNNAFFSAISDLIPGGLKKIYDPCEQQYPAGNTGGYVRVEVFEKTGKKEFQDENLLAIKQTLIDLKKDQVPLSDIAILCRRNNEGSLVAQYLIREGFDVVSADSLLLGNSSCINFVMAIIRYLNYPGSLPDQVQVLTYFLQTGVLDNNAYHDIVLRLGACSHDQNGAKDWEYADDVFTEALLNLGFDFRPGYLRRLPVYDLCESISRVFGFTKDNDPYLGFFLDAIHDFTQNNHPDYADVIDWWEENRYKKSIVSPESTDAIRIMTIHKSKGLEFPVVIFPFANQSVRKSKDNLWLELKEEKIEQLGTVSVPMHKDLENTAFAEIYADEMYQSFVDLVNLLYVVMTRAIDSLYVFTSLPPEKQEQITSVPGFFDYYFKTTSQFNEDGIYEFGQKSKPNNDQADPQQLYRFKSYISEDWYNRIVLSLQADEYWDTDHPDSRTEWGKLIHAILSEVYTKVDIDRVIEGYGLSGMMGPSQKQIISGLIYKLVDHPELKQYYLPEAEVRNEVDILDVNGQAYRPDRFVKTKNQYTIIDYKTGKFDEKHVRQIRKYEDVLQSMGYVNLNKILIYIGEKIEVLSIS